MKFTVASTFVIDPPRGGGQMRILHLYRRLAEHHAVDVICLAPAHEAARINVLAPGFREVRIPQTAAHVEAEAELTAAVGVPVTDTAFPSLFRLTPDYGAAIADSSEPDGILVAATPYSLPALADAGSGSELWYDSQNVETDLKQAMLPPSSVADQLIAATREVERRCSEQATRVLVASREDGARLRELFDVRAPIELVPNGIDCAEARFWPLAERRELAARLGLRRPTALFIGSWHEPNLVAVRAILGFARVLPQVRFLVAGSAGLAFADRPVPRNVEFLGVVSDAHKRALLASSDIALNPMASGSGTNIKMLDYLSAGIPVVTTPFGARGLELSNEHAELSEVDSFVSAISTVAEREGLDRRVVAARRHVERRFDWDSIATALLECAGLASVTGRQGGPGLGSIAPTGGGGYSAPVPARATTA